MSPINIHKTAYDLVLERDEIKSVINTLSLKTNSSFGRDVGIWDSLSRKQEELRQIEEYLKGLILK